MTIRRERGKDGVLTVANQQFAFTNCSFTAEYETETQDWSDDFHPYTSVINGTASGSYEFSGSHPPARDVLINTDGDNNGEPKLDLGLQVRLQEETFRATRVVVTEYTRDAPADGQSSGEVSWIADRFRFTR